MKNFIKKIIIGAFAFVTIFVAQSAYASISYYTYYNGSGSYSSSCRISSFSASDTSIDEGDSVTLKWRTTNCDNVIISYIGNVDDDGSEKVYLDETTTYILRAYGDDNSKSKSIRIYVVVDDDSTSYYSYNDDIVTTVATNISETTAQVNGLVTNSSYETADVYFRYGTTINLEQKTSSTTVKGDATFSSYLSGLTPNTVYYFQAVSSDPDGLSKGAIEVFKTSSTTSSSSSSSSKSSSTTIKKTTTYQGTTVTGSESPVVLTIENHYKEISEGDTVEYTIYYQNIGSYELTDPMIQVYIPDGMEVTNVSDGSYSESDNTVYISLDDIAKNDEGTIYIQAKVEKVDSDLSQIVTTAIIIYTNNKGAQENAMAYALNTPGEGSNSSLSAAAFFGNIFGDSTLIGWLFFIIIVLLLIIISRSIRNKKLTDK